MEAPNLIYVYLLLPLKAVEKSLRVKVETSFKVGIKESNVGKGH